ncbi:antitoxin VbhA family protein [Anaerovorax odorimutans]|uniref:antitoxin VbhA family protein n=1 Tax=Anaerovorax odorimutans TaxID=109327 RepID=UPI00040DEB5F|nr:antitoxin VbhA family protein [Anaerovorax odorimutans]
MGNVKKRESWDIAYGLIKVDGLEPTPEFNKLVEKEKRGEIKTKDIIKELNKKYTMKV